MGARSGHPGVYLTQRRDHASGRVTWAVRFVDPATGRSVKRSLEPFGLANAKARTAWAKALSARLAQERADLAAGIVRRKIVTVAEGLADYLADAAARQKPHTVRSTRETVRDFEAFLRGDGIETVAQITAETLKRWNRHLLTRPRRVAEPGGRGQGARIDGSARLSPTTVNRHLTVTRNLLKHWRVMGWCPLSSDGVADATARARQTRGRVDFLTAPEARALLAAVLEHDAAGYGPLAPMVLLGLLSGARLGEICALRWSDFHPDPPPGRLDIRVAIGEGGERVRDRELKTTKSGKERSLHLDITPALRLLLCCLKLRRRPGPYIFGGETWANPDRLYADMRRSIEKFGAPAWNWLKLRHTCGTTITNAPAVARDAAHWRSANWLGHSVTVNETHYSGLMPGLPATAMTIEAALGIEDLVSLVCGTPSGTKSVTDPQQFVARGS